MLPKRCTNYSASNSRPSSLASVAFADSMLFAGGKNETARTPIIINPFDQVDYFLFSGNSNGTIVDTEQRLSVPRWDLSGAGLSMLVDQTVYVALPSPITVPTNVDSSFAASATLCSWAAATPTKTCSTPSTCGPLLATEIPSRRPPPSSSSEPLLP